MTDTLARFAQRPRICRIRVDEAGAARLPAGAELDDLVVSASIRCLATVACRPSFAVRLLELLADLPRVGAPRADSAEIAWQAAPRRGSGA